MQIVQKSSNPTSVERLRSKTVGLRNLSAADSVFRFKLKGLRSLFFAAVSRIDGLPIKRLFSSEHGAPHALRKFREDH